MRFIPARHPESGGEASLPESALERYREKGWVPLSETPPAKSASKPEWVAYAVSLGADPDEAEASTKDDLIDQYT